MKSVAFFNNKGGVGKTTLLCNVAAYCAIKKGLKIAVIDADPQCNATQYLFDDDEQYKIYEQGGFTIHGIIDPLTAGEGFSDNLNLRRSKNFKLSVLPGDPRLALKEDFLARDWAAAKSGDIRGIKTNLVFSELLTRMNNYDIVFIDVSPSLGAINRSILLASDFFVSPMSIDIFSLRAFENISQWRNEWWDEWTIGISNLRGQRPMPDLPYGRAKFLGYVTQQYLAKRDASGSRRGVRAYEDIRIKIDDVITQCGLDSEITQEQYEIGTVPNLFSLVPMAQSSNKPVFELKSNDGVVGAHFAKVNDAAEIFKAVTEELLERLNA
jgi:cellulose biosynthesis protein BcsQ